MRRWISAAALAATLTLAGCAADESKPVATPKKETIVLVHGAFADSSSWNRVITRLEADGYPVVAASNPLRGLKGDADYVARIVRSIPGPVVLVGHSIAGAVITIAANDTPNVKALVYVAGFAPDAWESAAALGARFPTGTLAATLAPPIAQADGGQDLYIRQDKFGDQFAADLPVEEAAQMAAAQRPVVQAVLTDTVAVPAWKKLPSWFVYGALDRNIPATLSAFMAKRAHAREAVEIPGASHVVMVSNPAPVATLIERAAAAK